jgi:hypothetical protein
MNKTFLQTMFSSKNGRVYKWTHDVQADTDPVSEITESFLQHTEIETSVVVVCYQQNYLVYSDYQSLVESADFTLVTELYPDEILLPVQNDTQGVV